MIADFTSYRSGTRRYLPERRSGRRAFRWLIHRMSPRERNIWCGAIVALIAAMLVMSEL